MPITYDTHLHSSFSGDSDTPMKAMIEKAISLGMEGMCFTEHMDMDFPRTAEEVLDFNLNTDAYLYELLKMRETYGKQLRLRFGVELGVQPHLGERLSEYVKSYPFDFVIASSHLCHGKDPYYSEFYEGRTEEEAYREYFTSIYENLSVIEDFDVYGHLDYVVRYGPDIDKNYTYEKYKDILDKILEKIVSGGHGIEINTGGLPKGLKDLHPGREILKRYKELGGEIITIGSDAHTPKRIGESFARAEDALRVCGFHYYSIFQERKVKFVKL